MAFDQRTVSHAIIELLHGLGIRSVYGIVGGAIAPLADVLGRSDLRLFATRHEAGAAFAATEASLAANRPTAVLTTTGPGLTNAMTGLLAARSDGAKVIAISASTAPRQRGRYAVQEMSESGLVAPSVVSSAFDLAITIEAPEQLSQVAARLSLGLARPQGFVAHISLPLSLQRAPCTSMFATRRLRLNHAPAPELLDEVIAALREPFIIWAGFGARHAASAIRALAERTGAGVMVTPRGKGVFPETHPLFLGVTGIGGHDVERAIAAGSARHCLVLGTRLGEYSSVWNPRLIPPGGLIHVDVDPTAIGTAFPDAPTLPIVSDIGAFLQAMTARLPAASRREAVLDEPLDAAPVFTTPVRPEILMRAIQSEVVEGSDALVFAEPGNAFAWANHLLRFEAPRYRVSGYWASMGHMVTGAVGAALETGRSSLVLTGDGAMLMLNEISTAVQYSAPVVWVILNNACYGMTEAGMCAQGFTPPETRFPRVDFAALARSLGADGISVEHEAALADALTYALAARAPFVVDVRIDPMAIAPFLGRVQALAAMGAS